MDRKYYLNRYLPEFRKEFNAYKGMHSPLVGISSKTAYLDIFSWIICLCTDEAFSGDLPVLEELKYHVMFNHPSYNNKDIVKVFEAIFMDMQDVLDCSIEEVPLHINGVPPVKAIAMGRLRLGI